MLSDGGHTTEAWLYLISSYESLADLFFLYLDIGPKNKKKKKKKKKKNVFVNIELVLY